jgi:ABC-type phosphate transport system permease subunit
VGEVVLLRSLPQCTVGRRSSPVAEVYPGGGLPLIFETGWTFILQSRWNPLTVAPSPRPVNGPGVGLGDGETGVSAPPVGTTSGTTVAVGIGVLVGVGVAVAV